MTTASLWADCAQTYFIQRKQRNLCTICNSHFLILTFYLIFYLGSILCLNIYSTRSIDCVWNSHFCLECNSRTVRQISIEDFLWGPFLSAHDVAYHKIKFSSQPLFSVQLYFMLFLFKISKRRISEDLNDEYTRCIREATFCSRDC